MATAFEGCGKELVHDLTGHVVVDESAWHHEHVGIVVLTDEMGNLWNPCQPRTDALMLVQRHIDALARATDGDTREYFSLLDAMRQRMTKVRIVARLLVQRAIVLIGQAFLVQILFHKLFQGKASVVAGQPDGLHFHESFFFLVERTRGVRLYNSIT